MGYSKREEPNVTVTQISGQDSKSSEHPQMDPFDPLSIMAVRAKNFPVLPAKRNVHDVRKLS